LSASRNWSEILTNKPWAYPRISTVGAHGHAPLLLKIFLEVSI